MSRQYIIDGLGVGSTLSMIISWSMYKSIWWAIGHGLLGWLYVIYYAIVFQGGK